MQRERPASMKVRKQIISNRVSEPTIKQPKIVNHSRHSDGPTTYAHRNQIDVDIDSENVASKLRQLTINPRSKDRKYHEPELHIALAVGKRLENIDSAREKRIDSVSDLTPRTKTQVSKQIYQKLNFHSKERIYKKLVPVNVNDSVLEIKPARRSRKSEEKSKPVPKDPMPQLSDYLTPIEPQKNKYKLNLDDVELEMEQPSNDINSHFRELQEFYQQYLYPKKSLSSSICPVIAE